MPSYAITRARRGPRRRRLVVVNRFEDRLPGRVAFLVNLARLRAAQAAGRTDGDTSDPGHDDDDPSRPADAPPSNNDDAASGSGTTGESSPYPEWTKGELYDRARELDIAGRSKMNKAELVEALESHDNEAT